MISALGHDGADRLIEQVGRILKAHRDDVNAGKRKSENLDKAWCFRFGIARKDECAWTL